MPVSHSKTEVSHYKKIIGIVVEIGDAVKYCTELSNSQTLKDKYCILSFTWNSIWKFIYVKR